MKRQIHAYRLPERPAAKLKVSICCILLLVLGFDSCVAQIQSDSVPKTKQYKKEIVIDKTEKTALDKLQKDLAASQKKELEMAMKKWKGIEK